MGKTIGRKDNIKIYIKKKEKRKEVKHQLVIVNWKTMRLSGLRRNIKQNKDDNTANMLNVELPP